MRYAILVIAVIGLSAASAQAPADNGTVSAINLVNQTAKGNCITPTRTPRQT